METMTVREFKKFCHSFCFYPEGRTGTGLDRATDKERARAAVLIEQLADAGLIFDFMDVLDCFPRENVAGFLDLGQRVLRGDDALPDDFE